MESFYKVIKFIFFITLTLNSSLAAAQKETANWYFGVFAGLNFMTNPPSVLTNASIWSMEGSASISDASGNLLFYTDGSQIQNRQHVLMANGAGMNGNISTTQSAVIVKKPGSSNLFYVFTLSPNIGDLRYSVVDMLLAAGDGSVISKNNLVATNCIEKLAATVHCNGTDVWVVVHTGGTQDFQAFLVTPAGVSTTPVVSTVGSVHTLQPFLGSSGYMKISPNGKRLGVAIYQPVHKFEVFDFDNTTGVVSNWLALGTFTGAYGCEFSPDATKFYGSTAGATQILYQWDLCAGSAVAASLYTVSAHGSLGGMQTALNRKIYCTLQTDTLGVISKPNLAGAACNYIYNGQSIAPKVGSLGMPNFVSTLLKQPPPPFTYTLDPVYGCQTASFSPPYAPNPTNCAVGYSLIGIKWNFGDPATGISNISFLASPTHSFTSYGSYTVQVILYYSCGGSPDTLRQEVDVVPLPPLSISLNSSSLCAQALNGSANTIIFTTSGALTYTLVTSAPATAVSQNTTGLISTTSPYYPSGISTATLYGTIGACTASLATTFSIIPNPTVSITSSTPVICVGKSYTYTSAGANSYTWTSTTPNFTSYSNGGIAVTNPSINSVFTVYGTQLGCNSALVTSTITVNVIPTVSVNPVSSMVCKFSTTTLQASGSATDFLWSPNINISSTTGHEIEIQAVVNQTYTVVGSALGCTNSAFAVINVLDLPVPVIDLSKTAFCVGDELTLKGLGGVKYEWSLPNNFYYQGSPITFTAYNTFFAGEYTLTVTDEKGCKGDTTVFITLNPLPNGQLLGTFDGCAPLCNDFIFQAEGGNNFVSSWTIDNLIFDGDFKHCFLQPGEHSIKGQITDQTTSCKSTQTIKVIVHEKPIADFKWTPGKPTEELDDVVFLNNSSGQEINNWNWFIDEDISFSSSQDHFNYTFPKAGDYAVVLLVENKWGCADTAIKEVKIESDFVFYIPNAFTPNVDEKNESFKPVLNGVRIYKFEVFNRWGQSLFLTDDPAQGWDGNFRSQQCKQDTYVWKIILTTTKDEQKSFIGNVTLIR